MAYSEGKFKNEFGSEITMKLGSCKIGGTEDGVLVEVIGPASRVEHTFTRHEFEYLVNMGIAFQTKK